ncbi:hypothetical protein Tco_1164047 [Tanacetum coccineum]|uniref:Uncharacterized protein n=1 Tax=Tanacetum coccineum TaxID=301880 RepID=A0ABQ4YPX6_9ASTR
MDDDLEDETDDDMGGDDEVELTDEESFDDEDEITEVFRIDTNIFDNENLSVRIHEFYYLSKDLVMEISTILSGEFPESGNLEVWGLEPQGVLFYK